MRTTIFFAVAALLLAVACGHGGGDTTAKGQTDTVWWKQAVVYQVLPRSFRDSDGDGMGDLPGIISRLDYLKSLGITVVWLGPVFQSPGFDFDYDISDYYHIDPRFGTMADFDSLLHGLHARGIRLIMDIALNHTSPQHPWFMQSHSSRANPYRNYYHWWNAERGTPPKRWSFDVGGDAWRYDPLTNAYYLHYFSVQQPDLNWESPRVRQDIYTMMRFWLDKGIDGFRLDAFHYVAKDTSFPKLPEGYEKNINKYYASGPHLHDYIQEMNREVLRHYDIMTVGEGAGTSMEEAMKFADARRHEFSMAYHFEGVNYGDYAPDYDLVGFKKLYSDWSNYFDKSGWLAIFLGNHDQTRMVSHWANDSLLYRAAAAKMLATFVMTMRGTPFWYYGDELGMANAGFHHIDDFRDTKITTQYQKVKRTGGDTTAFLDWAQHTSRDNAHTPFQWDSSANAGFTTGRPWIKVNPDYTMFNMAAEDSDAHSVLNYFRAVVRLRRQNPTLVYGSYTLLDKENPNVYAYLRETGSVRMMVLLNFKNRPAGAHTGISLRGARLLLDNYGEAPPGDSLRPYEAAVYVLGD